MKSKILQIAGDASFRTFYRIILNKKSKIVISATKEKYNNLIAYTAVNTFLRKNKIYTPKLYFYNYSKGIVVVEDFGDSSFYDVLLKKKNKLAIYKKRVDLLIRIQKIKPKSKINNIFNKPHIIHKYSVKYLNKESDLFFDWYLPLFLSKTKVLVIKKETKKILSELYKNLHFRNSCFVHRDYHVQNLMKIRQKIGVIDSQDAVIGNPAYDLASLVDDVRLKTSIKLKNQIYKYYLKKNARINEEKFLKDFSILSVQRLLKIIGIFSRLYKRDKKKQYLKLIPYTWKLLDMRINSKIFLRLKKILDNHIPKKIRKKILYK